MKGWRIAARGVVLLWLLGMAVAWNVSCVFDKSGLRSGDAAQELPDVAIVDAWVADASLVDAELADAESPVDAGNPCLALDPPWWDLDWQRRRPLELGTVPADYTVTLELGGSQQLAIESHTRADLQDLRVLRYDGTWQELHRMVQPDPGVLSIRFRVREDQDGSPGLPRYFLYYDNSSAAAALSAPTEVFLFFDDFERPQLGIGTLYEQWNWDTFAPGSWWIDNGELVQDGTGSLTAVIVPGLAGMLDVGYAISYRWLGDPACADSGPIFHFDPADSSGYYLERQYSDAVLFSEPVHIEQGRQSMPSYADTNWHWHELHYYGGTMTFREDGNGPQYALALTPTGTQTVGLATFCWRVGSFRFDNLMVRLYQDPEPAPTASAEQICEQL